MSLMLICSVGGTSQPIVASVKEYKPARVILWHTNDTKHAADDAVRDSNVGEGCVDYRLVQDPQDFACCVADARKLRSDYDQWKSRSDEHEVIVDFTGGTKLMSAALALVTHRWNCRFSYVGGTKRTKDGIGTVEDGAEQPIRSNNPLDALAYQPIFDAIQIFNAGLPAAAVKLLEPVSTRSDLQPSIKRSVVAVMHVLRAYASWDEFQHGDAVTRFDDALKNLNDLTAILPAPDLSKALQNGKQSCEALKTSGSRPSRELVIDLIANAERRARLGLHDDAVARLYRAIEAFAQAELHLSQIDTGKTKIEQVPAEIRDQLSARPENDVYKLGLQDAYKLLRAISPDKAKPFFDEKLDADTSPLSARNQSILAHGFQPISDKTYKALKAAVDKLVSTSLHASFPTLPLP